MTTLTHDDWSRAAAGVDVSGQSLGDGAFVDVASGETFEDVCPATGRVLAAVAPRDKPDVDKRASGSGRDHPRHPVEHYSALNTTWIKC